MMMPRITNLLAKSMNVIAIIVTYNPDEERFRSSLNSLVNQVDHIIVIDNGSGNQNFVRSLCNDMNKCEFVEIGFNSGIAHVA
jgi:rhamnosyltransferase